MFDYNQGEEQVETITYQEHSNSIGELAAALAKAQGEMEGATKDSENPFFKSKYADLYSVWQACREPLSKNGIAIIQTTDNRNGNVIVITTMAHSSGEWIKGKLEIIPVKSDPQSMGSAITYGRRYALAAMVGVCPEDDDAEKAMNRNNKGNKNGSNEKPQKGLTEYKKEVAEMKTVKDLESWWLQNSLKIPELLSKEDFKSLVAACSEKKKTLLKSENGITAYYNTMKEFKETFGETEYRSILKEHKMENAASAKKKADRDRILNAFNAALELKKRQEKDEEYVKCPDNGDLMKISYCNTNKCGVREMCKAFE